MWAKQLKGEDSDPFSRSRAEGRSPKRELRECGWVCVCVSLRHQPWIWPTMKSGELGSRLALKPRVVASEAAPIIPHYLQRLCTEAEHDSLGAHFFSSSPSRTCCWGSCHVLSWVGIFPSPPTSAFFRKLRSLSILHRCSALALRGVLSKGIQEIPNDQLGPAGLPQLDLMAPTAPN